MKLTNICLSKLYCGLIVTSQAQVGNGSGDVSMTANHDITSAYFHMENLHFYEKGSNKTAITPSFTCSWGGIDLIMLLATLAASFRSYYYYSFSWYVKIAYNCHSFADIKMQFSAYDAEWLGEFSCKISFS